MPQPQLTVGRYNPRAYVPGGAPVNVAKAIQSQGFGGIKPKPLGILTDQGCSRPDDRRLLRW